MRRTFGEVLSEHGVPLSGSLWRRIEADSGQGLVEYAMIIIFVAVAAIVGLGVFGTEASALMSSVVPLPAP